MPRLPSAQLLDVPLALELAMHALDAEALRIVNLADVLKSQVDQSAYSIDDPIEGDLAYLRIGTAAHHCQFNENLFRWNDRDLAQYQLVLHR